MDVRPLHCRPSGDNSHIYSFQPNYVRSLHNLLTQSTSDDTVTLQAVCPVVRAESNFQSSRSHTGCRSTQHRLLYLTRMHNCALSNNL